MWCSQLLLLLLASITAESAITGGGAVKADMPAECDGVSTALWASQTHLVRGYHVLCVPDVCSETGKTNITICWNGRSTSCQSFEMDAMEKLVNVEEKLMGLRKPTNPARYAMLKKAKLITQEKGLYGFYKVSSSSEAPKAISSVKEFSGLILVFEGGNFLWPGIENGFKRTITMKPDGPKSKAITVQLQTLNAVRPAVFEVSLLTDKGQKFHLSTAKDCKGLVKKTNSSLKKVAMKQRVPGGVAGTDAGRGGVSTTIFVANNDDKLLKRMDRYIQALTLTTAAQLEITKLSRYRHDETFVPHLDAYEPQTIKGMNVWAREQFQGGMNNRFATVLLYLSSVTGGSTNFPLAGDPTNTDKLSQNMEQHQKNCDLGVASVVETGKHLLFYNTDAGSAVDESARHMGCNVLEGEKFLFNKWIWHRPLTRNFVKDESEED